MSFFPKTLRNCTRVISSLHQSTVVIPSCPNGIITCVRTLSTTQHICDLEEFFPPGVYDSDKLVDENPVVGRRWKTVDLRIRSNVDLHKLWYVLLKERNMLLTMHQEAKRLGRPVPGPTRLHKVERSMDSVKIVINERNKAVLELEKERRYRFDGPSLKQILDQQNEQLEDDGNADELSKIEGLELDNMQQSSKSSV